LPPGKKYTYRGGLAYVFIDTSGSISDQEISKFASELYAISRKYKYKYRIFNFSVGVTNEVNIRMLRKGTYKVAERGGTSVKDALKQVLQENRPPDIFMVFTDLYDDVPTPTDFMGKQVIYALTSGYNKDALYQVVRNKYQYIELD